MSFPLKAYYDLFFIAPEIVLMVWGLLVVLVDLSLARSFSAEVRRKRIGMLSLVGVGLAAIAALVVCWVPLMIRGDPYPDSERVDQPAVRGLPDGFGSFDFLRHDRR